MSSMTVYVYMGMTVCLYRQLYVYTGMTVCLYMQRSVNNAHSSFIHMKLKQQQPHIHQHTLLINKI